MERPIEVGLGVVAVLIGSGMVVAALLFGFVTPWATFAASLLGIAFLRWLTRSKALIRKSRDPRERTN